MINGAKAGFRSKLIQIYLVLWCVTQTFVSIHKIDPLFSISRSCLTEGSGLVSVLLLHDSRLSVALNLNIHVYVDEMIFKASLDESHGRPIQWEAAHIQVTLLFVIPQNMREYYYACLRPCSITEKN